MSTPTIFAAGRPPVFVSKVQCAWKPIPWTFTLPQWSALNQTLANTPATAPPYGLGIGIWHQARWGNYTYGMLLPTIRRPSSNPIRYFVWLCQ